MDNLTRSILAKACRGELVPQDDSDKPADKLLELIAQARAEAEALAKAAKKAEAAKKRAAEAQNNVLLSTLIESTLFSNNKDR